MEACVGLPAGPAVVAIDDDPTAEAHDTYKVSFVLKVQQPAGQVSSRSEISASQGTPTDAVTEMKDKKAAPRRCAGVSQNGAPGSSSPPLGHVVVRRPTCRVTNQPPPQDGDSANAGD